MILVVLAALVVPAVADEVDDLILDLKYGAPDVRERAALALGDIGDPRAVDPLIEILDSGCPLDVSEAAIIALGEIGDPRAVEPLLPLLQSSTISKRIIAAWALIEIGDPRTVDTLIGYAIDWDFLIAGASTSRSRYIANYTEPPDIIALAKIGGPIDVDSLIEILNSETSLDGQRITVRQVAAIKALGAIGDPKAVDAIIGVLSDPDAAVRSNASWALGEIGDARAIEPLSYVASRDWDPDVCDAASQALVKLGATLIPIEDNMTGPILDFKYGTPVARSTAALILVEVGRDDPRTIDLLIKALKDPYPIVRENAARALGIIRDPKAVDPLIEALEDRDDSVRNAAARALGEIGDPRAVDPLIDVSYRATPGAIVALGEIGDAKAADTLINYIRSLRSYSDRYPGDPETLRLVLPAIEALGKIGDTKSVNALFEILTFRDPAIRATAAKALGNAGDASAIEPLTYIATSDEEEEVRNAASEALEMLQDERKGDR